MKLNLSSFTKINEKTVKWIVITECVESDFQRKND